MPIVLLILFILGLGLGIVLNSLADNLPPDAENMRYPARAPRCRQCGQAFPPAYWLALAHWLVRGGRCPNCGARRPLRPALVELVSAAALAYLWLWAARPADGAYLELMRYIAGATVVLISLLIVVIDVEHRLILWSVVWPSAILLAALGSVTPGHGLVKTLLGGLAGYGITLGIFLLAELFARVMQRLRGEALDEVAFGGGDVNLAGLVGLAVGWPGVILALVIAIFAGGLFSFGYILLQLARRRYVPYSAVPYGPFLVLGALAIYLYGKDFAAVWLASH